MHYFGRNNMRYNEHENDGLFKDPEYTAALARAEEMAK